MKIHSAINAISVAIVIILSQLSHCFAEQEKSINATIDVLLGIDEFKAEAIAKLRQLGNEGMQVMIMRLKTATPEVRNSRLSAMIIFILKDEKTPLTLRREAIQTLIDTLPKLEKGHKSGLIANSIGLNDSQWLDAVTPYLEDADEYTRLNVLSALAKAGDKARAPAIQTALEKRRKNLSTKESRSDTTLLEGSKALKILEQGK